MSKICKGCKATNPDLAHYCGYCGKPLETLWGRDVYYSVVKSSEYNDLKSKSSEVARLRTENDRLKKKAQNTLGAKIKQWWSDFRGDDSVFETIWGLLGILFVICMVLWFLYWLCFKAFASDPELKCIEVDGKYGVGYSKDDLKVPALYDTISPKPSGNQWILKNNSPTLYGLAYVTDSVTKIVEPQYKDWYVYASCGNAFMERSDGTYDHFYLGEKINEHPYRNVNYRASRAYAVTHPDMSYSLIRHDGTDIANGRCSNIVIDPDTVIRVVKQRGNEYITTLYDWSGNKLSNKELHGAQEFSKGLNAAWANVTLDDVRNSRYSLIDRRGNVIYATPAGWSVYPATMGLFPVKNKDHKVGFIDNQGREVIPCKYTMYGYAFKSDSTLRANWDGKWGTLKIDGTFTPDAR